MRPDPERLTGYWRAAADQDVRLARAHASDESNAACFHAQQADLTKSFFESDARGAIAQAERVITWVRFALETPLEQQ